jgi:hypothetical protein
LGWRFRIHLINALAIRKAFGGTPKAAVETTALPKKIAKD